MTQRRSKSTKSLMLRQDKLLTKSRALLRLRFKCWECFRRDNWSRFKCWECFRRDNCGIHRPFECWQQEYWELCRDGHEKSEWGEDKSSRATEPMLQNPDLSSARRMNGHFRTGIIDKQHKRIKKKNKNNSGQIHNNVSRGYSEIDIHIYCMPISSNQTKWTNDGKNFIN